MQVLVHIYSNCILLPHFALGVGTLSDQGLAHSTEQPGVSPLRKKGRASKAWFVPTTTCATLLIFLSPPIVTPESFRHLFRHNVCVLLNLSFCHKLCNILFEWLSQHVLHQTGGNPSLNESSCQTVGWDEDVVGSPMQGGQQDSAAAHIAGNQGPHTTVPLSALPLLCTLSMLCLW